MHSSGPVDPSLLANQPSDPWFKLLRFQVSSLYIRQKSGGELLTAEFAWTPFLKTFRSLIGSAPRLAYFNLKSRSQSGGVSVISPALQLYFRLTDSIMIEGGIGVEEWKKSQNGATSSPS